MQLGALFFCQAVCRLPESSLVADNSHQLVTLERETGKTLKV